MMMGEFCNSTVYPLACKGPEIYYAPEAIEVKPVVQNLMTCTNNFDTSCVPIGVAKVYSLDIMNMVEELSIAAANVSLSYTTSSNTSDANDVNLMCFARHAAMPSTALYDYSSNLYKSPLVIKSPLVGRWYISIVLLNLTRKIGDTKDSDARVCYSMVSQLFECPLGKAGPNCTMTIYKLQVGLFVKHVSFFMFFCFHHIYSFFFSLILRI